MSRPSLPRRSVLAGLAAAALGALPMSARALCVKMKEEGRWRNLDHGVTDPAYVDIRMIGCGDQMLNGRPTETSYVVRVWVRQWSGEFYGRPQVNAAYRTWKGQRWLYARVPTGGYLDHLWLRTMDHQGQPHLRVLIEHESLDNKPDASSNYWFRQVGAQVTYNYLYPDMSTIYFTLGTQAITPSTSLVDTKDLITTTFTSSKIVITDRVTGPFASASFNGPGVSIL
jgi:hypothetical protein